MTDDPKFSFVRAFRRHLRDGIAYYGVRRAIWNLLAAFFQVLRDFLPDRRRASFGDLEFDFDHSADTTRSNVSFGIQFMAALTGNQYFPSEPWLFQEIMQSLSIDFHDFTFIDIGSGKGRALLMSSDYPFRRIVGIEFMPELNAVAQQNIAAYADEKRQCMKLESLCLDARDFEFPPGPLVVYFFNPFPAPVFARVVENLERSYSQNPRAAYVACRYRTYTDLLAGKQSLEKIAEREQWEVYRFRSSV